LYAAGADIEVEGQSHDMQAATTWDQWEVTTSWTGTVPAALSTRRLVKRSVPGDNGVLRRGYIDADGKEVVAEVRPGLAKL